MKEEYRPFAEHFVTMFAPEILKIYLWQVELYVSNQHGFPRSLNIIFLCCSMNGMYPSLDLLWKVTSDVMQC